MTRRSGSRSCYGTVVRCAILRHQRSRVGLTRWDLDHPDSQASPCRFRCVCSPQGPSRSDGGVGRRHRDGRRGGTHRSRAARFVLHLVDRCSLAARSDQLTEPQLGQVWGNSRRWLAKSRSQVGDGNSFSGNAHSSLSQVGSASRRSTSTATLVSSSEGRSKAPCCIPASIPNFEHPTRRTRNPWQACPCNPAHMSTHDAGATALGDTPAVKGRRKPR